MSPNSATDTFKGLANVNRFSVVVIESVNAPLVATDSFSPVIKALEKRLYFFPNSRDIGWKSTGFSASGAGLFGMRRLFLQL